MTNGMTNNNAVTSEITTPVTNNQVEVEEEGGSSLLALVGEWPDPGMLLERGSSGMLSRQLFPSHSDGQVILALDTSLSCRWCFVVRYEAWEARSTCEHVWCERVVPQNLLPVSTTKRHVSFMEDKSHPL